MIYLIKRIFHFHNFLFEILFKTNQNSFKNKILEILFAFSTEILNSFSYQNKFKSFSSSFLFFPSINLNSNSKFKFFSSFSLFFLFHNSTNFFSFFSIQNFIFISHFIFYQHFTNFFFSRSNISSSSSSTQTKSQMETTGQNNRWWKRKRRQIKSTLLSFWDLCRSSTTTHLYC